MLKSNFTKKILYVEKYFRKEVMLKINFVKKKIFNNFEKKNVFKIMSI